MSGLRPKGTGRCTVPGHGHNGLKGYAHGLICGVAAMMPRRSKKQERLAGKREVEDQRHD